MTHRTTLSLMALAAISLAACNGDATSVVDNESQSAVEIASAEMDHAGKMMDGAMSDTGHTTGTLMSISPDGQSATINHAAIEAVGMGAMTMGFDIMSGVDLSEFTAGDPVSFMVKRGLDGSYRITAICNTKTDGDDCLSAAGMDHTGH